MSEVEEAEFTDLTPAIREFIPMPANLIEGSRPAEIVANAQEIATALAQVVEDRKLFKQIGPKKHVLVEGWTLLGSLLGVVPIVEWTRPTADGWEARVVAKTMSGIEVGAAEAMCSRKETRWRTADDYAIRSMAQTRAVSKALRHPLGFIMQLAGFEPTPEAEIPTAPPAAPAAPAGPKSWKELLDAHNKYLYQHPWQEWWIEAVQRGYDLRIPTDAPFKYALALLEEARGKDELAVFWRTALEVFDKIPRHDLGPDRSEVRAAWAAVMDGIVLQGPQVSMSPDEADILPTYEMYLAGDLRPASVAAQENELDQEFMEKVEANEEAASNVDPPPEQESIPTS